MKRYETWAWLNAEGKAVWGAIFPEGEIPVQSIIPQPASLEGIAKPERIFLVDWKQLTKQQQDSVLEKLSEKSGAGKDAILKDILKVGLPLREKYTECCGTTRMELFF